MWSWTSLKLIWFWLEENGLGLLRVVVAAAALTAPIVYYSARQASPIIGKSSVSGTVETLVHTPAGKSGRSPIYNYLVRLDDGRLVGVSGPISRPKRVGDTVGLTRYERASGRTTYEFAETRLPYRSDPLGA